METYVKLAQTFAGRDKLMRTTGYTLVLISSSLSGDSSKKLSIVAKQISSARIIMRLFDDIPGFNNTKRMGADEIDKVCRILTIISNISTQVFYPCEHIAWMTDLGVLGKSSRSWWAASTSCWALSLLCSFLKNVKKLMMLREKELLLRNQHEIQLLECGVSSESSSSSSSLPSLSQFLFSSSSSSSSLTSSSSPASKELLLNKEQTIDEFLNLLKNLFDFILAVSMLPWQGFLWAGRATQRKKAIFGIISSLSSVALLIRSHNRNNNKNNNHNNNKKNNDNKNE